MNTNNCYFWATPSGPIRLIEGDKMPVKTEMVFGLTEFLSRRVEYLKAAKALSVPIQDQDAAWRVIHPDIKLAKNFKVNDRGSLSYQIGNHHFERSHKADVVHGPFTVEYRIEDACAHDSCPVDGMCEHCKEPVKVAILYDDTPEKEPRKDQDAFLLHLIDVTACFVMEQNMFLATPTRKELIQKARETFTITRKQ